MRQCNARDTFFFVRRIQRSQMGKRSSRRSESGLCGRFQIEFCRFFSESTENARARLTHSGGSNAQLGCDGPGREAVDDTAPEHLPGPRFKLTADEFQRTPIELAVQLPFLVVRFALPIRLVEDQRLCVRTARRWKVTPDAAEVLE